MSNLNKWYKTEEEQTDLRVISFVARNKDNIDVTEFSSRKTSFVSTMTDEELIPIFEAWAKQGKKNEFSRMYVSINKRDHKSVQLSLMHYLLDNQNLNLGSLDSRIAMIAAQSEHALEKKYFYDFDGNEKQLEEFITDKTKIVSMCHASNVLGNINPVYEVGELLKDKDIYFVVDAAQSVPHVKIDVQKMNCDFLAFSAHKMCGPTGIGVLYGKKQLLEKFDPVEFGGGMIGIVEDNSATWAILPDKFEAGTPLLAQAAGLGATINYLNSIGLENIEKYTKELTEYMYSELSKIDNIEIYGTKNIEERVSLITFNLVGVHPHDLTSFLDEKGICIRAGHQCTQPLLGKLGTYSVARASLYLYNTKEEIDFFIQTLKETKEFFENEF